LAKLQQPGGLFVAVVSAKFAHNFFLLVVKGFKNPLISRGDILDNNPIFSCTSAIFFSAIFGFFLFLLPSIFRTSLSSIELYFS